MVSSTEPAAQADDEVPLKERQPNPDSRPGPVTEDQTAETTSGAGKSPAVAKLSKQRKVHGERVLQPIYMGTEDHDRIVHYCEARRDASIEPWKISHLFRVAVEEYIARNPVPSPSQPVPARTDTGGRATRAQPGQSSNGNLGSSEGPPPVERQAGTTSEGFHD